MRKQIQQMSATFVPQKRNTPGMPGKMIGKMKTQLKNFA
jgi:hypothetical protein